MRSKAELVSLVSRTEHAQTKKVEKRKTKMKKTDMLRKQSGESVESVLKKKRKAMSGRIYRNAKVLSLE